MRSRGLVVAIAVVLAVLAAVGVIVYTSNVRETAVDENTTPVLASTQDIQANTPLDPLIAQGVFQHDPGARTTASCPGAVTDESQLQGQTAAAPIYQNEQIPLARISVGSLEHLGIDPGNIGLGLEVAGAGCRQRVSSSRATTSRSTRRSDAGTLVTKQGLKVLLTPAQLNKAFAQALGGTPTTGAVSTNVFQVQTDFTIALVPSVEVLSVQNPPVDTDQRTDGRGRLDLRAQHDTRRTPRSSSSRRITRPCTSACCRRRTRMGTREPGTIGVPFGKVIGVSK